MTPNEVEQRLKFIDTTQKVVDKLLEWCKKEAKK